MKVTEIKLKDFSSNIRKNYKLVLIIIIVCVIIGIICGIISAKLYNPNDEVKISQLQEHIDLSYIEKDGEYYYNAFFELKEKNDYVQAYLKYFEQVDISNESRSVLASVEEEILNYQDDFEKAEDFYKEYAPVIFQYKDAAITFYNEKIEQLDKEESNLEQKLDDIIGGKYTIDYKQAQQDAISSDILTIENNIEVFNNQIDVISKASQNKIEEIASEADKVLSKNINVSNKIIDRFNTTLEVIAEKENYEIVYNKRLINEYFENAGFNGQIEQEDILEDRLGRAVIYAKSIAGLDIPSERFFATVTFFALFGVVLAFVVGAVYVPTKKETK